MCCVTLAAFIMWSEFRSGGILNDLVRWQSVTFSTLLSSLAFISAGWNFVFPELPRRAVPAHEVVSILKLAHVDIIIEALTLVRVSLQIPANAFVRTLLTQRPIGINFMAVSYQPFCFCVSFSDSSYKTMDTYQRFLKCYTSTSPRCSVTLCFPHLLNFAICVPTCSTT